MTHLGLPYTAYNCAELVQLVWADFGYSFPAPFPLTSDSKNNKNLMKVYIRQYKDFFRKSTKGEIGDGVLFHLPQGLFLGAVIAAATLVYTTEGSYSRTVSITPNLKAIYFRPK